jgi:hypothetical protein
VIQSGKGNISADRIDQDARNGSAVPASHCLHKYLLQPSRTVSMLRKLAMASVIFVCCIHGAQTFALGNYGVSAVGSAQYNVPIWTPPGIGQIQPQLALVYDTNSGPGIMGPGWNLAGLSAISRCKLTYAQDGVSAAVTLTAADRFCLDGNRLRLTSSETLSTYGAPSTTYQTEVANFALVTASAGTAGNGPASFIVQGKNGLTYEYGATTDSRVLVSSSNPTPYVWALDKVTDRSGNSMTYAYTQTNGTYQLSSILYGASTASPTPIYQVNFYLWPYDQPDLGALLGRGGNSSDLATYHHQRAVVRFEHQSSGL